LLFVVVGDVANDLNDFIDHPSLQRATERCTANTATQVRNPHLVVCSQGVVGEFEARAERTHGNRNYAPVCLEGRGRPLEREGAIAHGHEHNLRAACVG